MKSRTTPRALPVDYGSVNAFARRGNRCVALQMLWLGCLALLMTEGCMSLGATIFRSERINDHLALQQTNDEPLLFNLVRLKDRDTPIF